MNLCCHDPQGSQISYPVYQNPQYHPPFHQYPSQQRLYFPDNGRKLSVKTTDPMINYPPHNNIHPQYQQYPIPNYSQTPSNIMAAQRQIRPTAYQQSHKNSIVEKSNVFKKSTILDRLDWTERSRKSGLNNSSHSMEARLYRSFPEKQSQESTLKSTRYQYTEPTLQNSYAELLKQNMELKRIIKEQYMPLKGMYEKLQQQHQNRQYLVSQLEWKVRQLAKQVSTKRK